MISLTRVSVIVATLMIIASIGSSVLKPRHKLAIVLQRDRIENQIPMQIGDWRGRSANNIVAANPQMTEKLSRLYTEIINRTYVDSRGRQIMLSIAYGEDQRDGMQIHYPEVCYPAQGFIPQSAERGWLATSSGVIRIKRLSMVQGQRVEKITYWAMIGEHQSLGGVDKKVKEMRYSFAGKIPDGLLFRVSSIENDAQQAYGDHDDFVRVLVANIDREARLRLTGLQ